jgi:predicted Zn finger-like uncharacterized protein
MFTDCPGCQRQFHIYAEQLTAANGLVKCGYCGMQFNAMGRLRDEPLLPSELPPPVEDETSPVEDETPPDLEQNAEFASTSSASNEPPADDLIEAPAEDNDFITDEESQVQQETIEHVSDAYNLIAEGEDPDSEDEPQFQLHQGDDSIESNTTDMPEDISKREVQNNESVSVNNQDLGSESNDIPEILLEDEKPKSSLLSRLFWSFIIFTLIFLASLQVAWFQRDELIIRYPELIPWISKVCDEFECEVIRFRDVAAIVLMNRDVREHPRYENALLVNATMSNQSHTRQVFPGIQLSLFDTNGDLIGHRAFSPSEYLDDSISQIYGMAPNIPVHFVLEVTGDTEGAVSFEFDFL